MLSDYSYLDGLTGSWNVNMIASESTLSSLSVNRASLCVGSLQGISLKDEGTVPSVSGMGLDEN